MGRCSIRLMTRRRATWETGRISSPCLFVFANEYAKIHDIKTSPSLRHSRNRRPQSRKRRLKRHHQLHDARRMQKRPLPRRNLMVRQDVPRDHDDCLREDYRGRRKDSCACC